ncbi:MAG: phosphoglycerate dehydrogenase [Desulfovibrio sp.]|uniref:phosphoglycerate dehydrogenase n=1 Tax=Desulfovibrio sp. 7SRBS1 TaxID=3378064 RepID=UPI003B3D06E5
MTTIVTTSPAFGTIGRVPEAIAERDWTLIRCTDTDKPQGGVGEHLDTMEIMVVGLIGADKNLINNAPRLKAILKHGVGVDNIDIPAATAKGIPVINAPGTNANAVAELVLGSMLSLARRIPMVHKVVVEGGWQRHVGSEIEGKTLGIVGLGCIGRSLAAKAVALGMRVVASDLKPDMEFVEKHGIELRSLDELLSEADYVSLHVFGGKDNSKLIGAEQIALMKPTAYLLNFARGEIVDLDALAAALDKEELLGAAIDAYEQEPPDISHPIFKHPRVVFTPHSGADTKESVERMGLMNVQDIDAVLAGEPSPRVLNPEIYK